MRKDLENLKRRPFLFPLLMPIALFAVAVVVAVWVFDARATTIVVLVRHAETEPSTDPDPNLSLSGKERAARLARMLASLQSPRALDAVFAADSRRAQQTVQPLAETLSLPINVVPPAAWSELTQRIRREHRGEVVLVAGDAKSIPSVIASFTDQNVTIADGDFDALYIIFSPQLSRTRLLTIRY